MGGHAAWKKRVARGELAKGMGGAIMRHRPRLGRKGKDLILNRKGHIAGGNPKKMKKRNRRIQRNIALAASATNGAQACHESCGGDASGNVHANKDDTIEPMMVVSPEQTSTNGENVKHENALSIEEKSSKINEHQTSVSSSTAASKP